MERAGHLKTSDFDYHLPPALIAQEPLPQRDSSRLLVYDRASNQIEHKRFADIIQFFRPGDVLVINDSRVIPARLFGRKTDTGGRVELLLLEPTVDQSWRALVGGSRLLKGANIQILDLEMKPSAITAKVAEVLENAERIVRFNEPVEDWLEDLGRTPLPPYIKKPIKDPDRYQTVYAQPPGSAAAPTAGMHFSPEILLSLREIGVIIERITLHIGLDTFKPISSEFIQEHSIHSEKATLSAGTAQRINKALLAGGRIWAVGTTTVRTLETAALRSAGVTGSLAEISARDSAGEDYAACAWRPLITFEGRSDLYIYPGYKFRAVDIMITNFHLPKSSLILLVSAFAGREAIKRAYREAVDKKYRFYSFGDAMLIM